MYCPQCKAEYRQGFTRCADCDVQLVQDLASSSDAAADKDPFCQFWKGEDPRVFAELCAVLEESGIPYRKVEWQDHLFNTMRFPEFRLAVPFSKFEKAEQAVVEAYGSTEEADNAMYPTTENREGYRELISWTHEEKWKQRGRGAPGTKDDEPESAEEDES
jgi:hypothetical protein